MKPEDLFKPAIRRPESWHEVEFIQAVSPEGTKLNLGYHFYDGLMRVWMFGCTHHSPQALKAAGWNLVMPLDARRN